MGVVRETGELVGPPKAEEIWGNHPQPGCQEPGDHLPEQKRPRWGAMQQQNGTGRRTPGWNCEWEDILN